MKEKATKIAFFIGCSCLIILAIRPYLVINHSQKTNMPMSWDVRPFITLEREVTYAE